MSFVPVMQQLIDAAKAQHEAIDRLFAMVIAKSTLEEMFFPSESGQPWEAMKQGRIAVEAAEKVLRDWCEEDELEEVTHMMMRDILVATAEALKGPPAPLTLHSWHDLPELAARLRDEAHLRATVDGDDADA